MRWAVTAGLAGPDLDPPKCHTCLTCESSFKTSETTDIVWVFLGACCFETNIWSDCESSLVSVQPQSCEIATVLPGCFFREEQVSKGSWLTGLGAWSWGWTCCGWGNSRERHCRRIGGAWLCVSRSGSGRCCVDPVCLFAVFYNGILTLHKRRLQPPVLKSAHLKSLNLKARVLES